MKAIVLITGTEHTREFLENQLKEYLQDIAYIKSYAVDEGFDREALWGDLFVFSSRIVQEEVNLNIPEEIPVVVAKRTINYSYIDKLFMIPEGSTVLYVNDVKETALTGIDALMNLELNHIRYVPYYPGIKSYRHCEIAVTPGEEDKVPKEVKTVIDIGIRPLDMSTYMEILYKLGYQNEIVVDMSTKYIKKIIELSKNLARKSKAVMEYERSIKNEIIKKRYYAKYNFDNIIGESIKITDTKNVARKLAATDLAILIEGESGTGKELFASAIHMCSNRKNGPYVAVNFSALPESLVESELFGYEGGAFTGAKKTGKIGIFEQANGGTIFLDEIGDASLAVQARLLRVLQEKEIMRVGGDRIISVDIRIVAATNKNLLKLIDEGKFREDLYYRLKMGYINIPPLRERKTDVPLIAREYLRSKGKGIALSEAMLTQLKENNWRGNVRELINTLEYASAVCDEDILTENHLPTGFSASFRKHLEVFEVDEETIMILKEIYNSQKRQELVGRRMLSENLKNQGIEHTEQSIRTKLNSLEKLGLIVKGRGKLGTKLTSKGIELIQNNQNK